MFFHRTRYILLHIHFIVFLRCERCVRRLYSSDVSPTSKGVRKRRLKIYFSKRIRLRFPDEKIVAISVVAYVENKLNFCEKILSRFRQTTPVTDETSHECVWNLITFILHTYMISSGRMTPFLITVIKIYRPPPIDGRCRRRTTILA